MIFFQKKIGIGIVSIVHKFKFIRIEDLLQISL